MRLVRGISIASLVVSVATLALVLVMFVGDRWESAEDTQNFTEAEVEQLVRYSVGEADCFDEMFIIESISVNGSLHAGFTSDPPPMVTFEHSFKPNGLWLVEVNAVWAITGNNMSEVLEKEPSITVIGEIDGETAWVDEGMDSPITTIVGETIERKCIYRVNDHTGDVSSFR